MNPLLTHSVSVWGGSTITSGYHHPLPKTIKSTKKTDIPPKKSLAHLKKIGQRAAPTKKAKAAPVGKV